MGGGATFTRRRCFAAAAALALSAAPQGPGAHAAAADACAVRHYALLSVPLRPAALNNAGQVAGTTGEHRAAVWSSRAGLRVLPLPPGFFHSEAVAINDRGHILGIAYDQAFANQRPFLFANDVLTLLPGNQARAYRISASNVIAGEALVADRQKTEPVLWSGDGMRPLGSCCGGSAQAVNEAGQVVGNAYDVEGRYHAYLWTQSGGMQWIGPPDRYSSAIAINARGDVIVQSLSRVFLYSKAGLTPVALSPKYPSHARAINGCGVMVGSFGPFSDKDRAFVWSAATGFQDLNALITSNAPGLKLESATDINERGEIVVKGDAKAAEDGGFLLVPAP